MAGLDNTTIAVLTAVVVLLALALAAWATHGRRQSARLQQRFGPEYGRAVAHWGDRDKAEAELLERERRVQQLHIRPLAPHDAGRFAHEWRRLQARFVDDPRGSLAHADLLVRELMMVRGYPMADFERRAADVSVDHPAVVDHYRTAHAIAERDGRDAGDTEDLRKAVVHYRALFSDLLEVAEPRRGAHRTAHVRLMEIR
jgi:hypothetical protein